MGINFLNQIKSLEVTDIGDFQNVVTKIYWQRRGVERNSFTSSVFQGVHKLNTSNISSGSFIEYDNLTSSDVVGWLEQQKTSEFWTKVDQRIESEISASLFTKEEKFDLPWQQQE